MKLAEIAALADGLSPVIRDLMAAAVNPLLHRIDELEAELRSRDDVATIRSLIDEAVAKLPPAPPGKDGAPGRDGANGADGVSVDPGEIARMVSDAVAALPPAKDGRDGIDGKSIDPADIERMIADAVAAIPAPKDGKDGLDGAAGKDIDPAEVERMVGETVERVLSGWEKPKDGRSVSAEELVPLIDERLPALISEAVARIPLPKDGKDGAPGKLPIVKAWIDGAVHYEADVVTHDGATYQALRDTAKAPPHEDWICLAARGVDGADGRSFAIRGTFDAAAEYSALDVVSLNGASFAAKRDKPGACPGDGWQLIAMQGKRGERGESVKGDPGKAIKGDPGEPVVAIDIDDHGLLTLTNGDGSTVTCDLYPLLSKLDR